MDSVMKDEEADGGGVSRTNTMNKEAAVAQQKQHFARYHIHLTKVGQSNKLIGSTLHRCTLDYGDVFTQGHRRSVIRQLINS